MASLANAIVLEWIGMTYSPRSRRQWPQIGVTPHPQGVVVVLTLGDAVRQELFTSKAGASARLKRMVHDLEGCRLPEMSPSEAKAYHGLPEDCPLGRPIKGA